MDSRLWSECPKEEKDDVKKWSIKVNKLKATYQMGYLTPEGYEYYKNELEKELDEIESTYSEEDLLSGDSEQLTLF